MFVGKYYFHYLQNSTHKLFFPQKLAEEGQMNVIV